MKLKEKKNTKHSLYKKNLLLLRSFILVIFSCVTQRWNEDVGWSKPLQAPAGIIRLTDEVHLHMETNVHLPYAAMKYAPSAQRRVCFTRSKGNPGS